MAQTADVCRNGGGEGDALVGQVAACGQLVGVRTVGRFEGFVVARQHGDFVYGVFRIPAILWAVCSGI